MTASDLAQLSGLAPFQSACPEALPTVGWAHLSQPENRQRLSYKESDGDIFSVEVPLPV